MDHIIDIIISNELTSMYNKVRENGESSILFDSETWNPVVSELEVYTFLCLQWIHSWQVGKAWTSYFSYFRPSSKSRTPCSLFDALLVSFHTNPKQLIFLLESCQTGRLYFLKILLLVLLHFCTLPRKINKEDNSVHSDYIICWTQINIF